MRKDNFFAALDIVLSVFAHKLGPWLPLALATMIVTKIDTLAYLRAKKQPRA